MSTNQVNSRRSEFENFEFNIEKACSFDELKHSLAKILNLQNSQVMVCASDEVVDNFEVIVAKVRNYTAGFKTHVELYNYVNPQNPLPYLRLLCIELQTSMLIEALDIVSIWVMCSPQGRLSYVNAVETEDENEDDFLTLSAASPCRPFYGSNDTNALLQPIDSIAIKLLDLFAPYLHSDFSEIRAQYHVLDTPGIQGQYCQLGIWGYSKKGEQIFLDLDNISGIAITLETISVLSGKPENKAINSTFKITANSVELEQESPGHAFKYSKEA